MAPVLLARRSTAYPAVRPLLLISVAVLSFSALGRSNLADRELRVGLLRDRTTSQLLVMSARGVCGVYADGVRKGELRSNDGLRIGVVNGSLTARSLTLSFNAKRIEVIPAGTGGGFRMRDPNSKQPERTYPGRLEVSASGGHLSLVAHVPLESYTAGVVSAEAGNSHHMEYYKLQSVSCRTYVLTNLRKHQGDGFDVCDGVHCQVFHGSARNDSIREAVDATRGLVIVNADIQLIHATFHSNCGGETMNAEDLWSKPEPYLRSTVDTFCLHAPHAVWQKTMARSEWLGYLSQRYGLRKDDPLAVAAVLRYEPHCRDLYLGNTWPLVPLKHVREDLQLKSTYFSVTTEGERVLLSGRGFGHAVGLCQEGAMAMARAGIGYTDILHHYYAEVHLVDLGTLDFFRDEDPVPVGSVGGPKGQ